MKPDLDFPVRLLLVEDEPRLRRSLSEELREQRYAVDEASDGPEGLYKAENTAYDAIILDGMLPGFDGFEVLRRFRRHHQTPVIMLTARDSTADRVRGLDVGADDYLGKPFELPELLARIRVIIRRAVGQASTALEIGPLTIDTGLRTVHCDGQPVALTTREYSILEYLALHRGRVITRTELLEHIFDEHADRNSNVLDVHVSALRRKIGHDLIVTRRGHGFCIV